MKKHIMFILTIMLVICLGGCSVFRTKEQNEIINEAKDIIDPSREEINNKDSVSYDGYVKTRSCSGTYVGTGDVGQNFFTKEYSKGEIKIELNVDGTFRTYRDNIPMGAGTFIIIEDALLFKEKTDMPCNPETGCEEPSYLSYADISEDCTKISSGYGYDFMTPDFTLNRQN